MIKYLRVAANIIALVLFSSPFLVYLLTSYKLSKIRAKRAALKELKAQGIDERACEELISIIVPDLGGMKEWVNWRRSESCC
ncbi:MAG TPA: hypothetical protein ENF57_04165 [Candidatus Korarchaeota archaeon]|nr:hypothetical protein [Candidatus Korarchaeota archaeon]